jgi:ADP-dependent NAD(P)H-hydrate dehydratase / NAD(P)H-hydrate epimerase
MHEHEIITVAEMYAADRYAAEHGIPTLTLMESAGRAVADEVLRLKPKPCPVVVLCGPGNNGGDGFVVARLLKARGWPVRLALLGERGALKGDAAFQSVQYADEVEPLAPAVLDGAELVVDAMYGAGLSRPLEGAARETVIALNAHPATVVAVDVPSGLHGDLGRAFDGLCVAADATVTFFRLKPAHVLMPGRIACGRVSLAQIGIPEDAVAVIGPKMFVNGQRLWGGAYPKPGAAGHKYARGHAVVVSGPAQATGAARLAARGALRIGAGLVSVASPLAAVDVNAKHLTAIMVKPFDGAAGLAQLLEDKRYNAVAIGPGVGVGEATRVMVYAVVDSDTAAVLDADALTSFAGETEALFGDRLAGSVMTPHEGEFERLFPGVLKTASNRIEAARAAAVEAGCVVLLKGPDTVVAAPDGRASINTNAPPWLATAGSGDVLAGFILGLLAQHMEPFLAASAAVWMHGLAATQFGPGLIAEDIPEQVPALLRRLYEEI